MAKYVKKPVVVDAEVYHKGLEDGFVPFYMLGSAYDDLKRAWFTEDQIPYIETLEGRHYISPGDYIITGVKGERYPCKPDIFKMTYNKLDVVVYPD
jgi:hypothetical protein